MFLQRALGQDSRQDWRTALSWGVVNPAITRGQERKRQAFIWCWEEEVAITVPAISVSLHGRSKITSWVRRSEESRGGSKPANLVVSLSSHQFMHVSNQRMFTEIRPNGRQWEVHRRVKHSSWPQGFPAQLCRLCTAQRCQWGTSLSWNLVHM